MNNTVKSSRLYIPQLEKNYPELLQWKKEFLANFSGIHICGFGWEGIGLNDMMKCGVQVATDITNPNSYDDRKAEVKGIYF